MEDSLERQFAAAVDSWEKAIADTIAAPERSGAPAASSQSGQASSGAVISGQPASASTDPMQSGLP
eukprot:4503711-Karenia_brevis.AAC.1